VFRVGQGRSPNPSLNVTSTSWPGSRNVQHSNTHRETATVIHVREEHSRLAAAELPVTRKPRHRVLGLAKMWIEDPDGIRMVLVEFPLATLSCPAVGLTAAATTAMRHYVGDPCQVGHGLLR
jgi:hypothetical protein